MPEDPWKDPPKLSREFFDDDAEDLPAAELVGDGDSDHGGHVPTAPELVVDGVISPPLRELMASSDGRPMGVVIELSTGHEGGLAGAAETVHHLLRSLGVHQPVHVEGYVATELSDDQVVALVQADREAAGSDLRGAVYRIWPNFGTTALTLRSIVTTKCDAAHRSFNATGAGVTWAVLDSGIDSGHEHFTHYRNLDGLPHKSFVHGGDEQALVDEAGHGTHVAGILAGYQPKAERRYSAATWFQDETGSGIRSTTREFDSISGMAPATRLLSCQVLREDGTGDAIALIGALQYIGQLNSGGAQVVHGVNISVGYPFDPSWFATGLTPVCHEVNRLVRSGVVVVVAAGNTGFGYALNPHKKRFRLGLGMTINDPGNADLAVTVGSTSCSPHTTGVSYFSSKGPTGDGRVKPDLVAPGERIISAAAGRLLAQAQQVAAGATYVENSGTSMAAPHVSGAAAAFLSVHREFLGQPDKVRQALVAGATDLRRSPHFQGAGLVDAMRSIQSV